jgi:hypothetical protein
VRRVMVVLALAVVAAMGVIACDALIGLRDPVVENEAGGTDDALSAADVDNGEASTTYPAFRFAVPQLVSKSSGAVMKSPLVTVVAFAGDVLAPQIVQGGQVWISSGIWSTQTGEYGVGATTVGPLVTVTDPPPASASDPDIQAWLAGKLDGTHPEFGSVDAGVLDDEVFILLYPLGTTITNDGRTSCQQFAGYHSSFALGGAAIVYIVLPRCDGSDTALTTLSAATGYETLATVTNPRPAAQPLFTSFDTDDQAWNFLDGDGGDDNGSTELPQPCKGAPLIMEGGLALPRSWSYSAISESRDPCVPPLYATPYFASTPVMNDEVAPPGLYPAKGIQLAVGQSKTVEVLLWSEGPTSGPWTVEASVLPGFPGGGLGFVFDRDAGTNGEKLHLTVTANEAGVFPFAITSTLGTRTTTWMGIVGP